MEKLSFRDRLRKFYMDAVIWLATKLNKRAQALLVHVWELAIKWDDAEKKLTIPGLPQPQENPVAEPPESLQVNQEAVVTEEKPSVRHRRRRAERKAAEASVQPQEATAAPAAAEVAAQAPTPRKGKLPTPDINPFSDGSGPVPLCMDPLPEFVVFEAMFHKKYGKSGRCTLNYGGTSYPYNAFELFTLMSKIEADGEKASPQSCALYGTVMSLVLHQHGKKIDAKALS